MGHEAFGNLLLATLALAFGLFTFFRGFLDLQDKRTVENTPRSKCRSVALGPVEVSGTAAGDETIHSVIAKIPCFCSQVRVDGLIHTRNGKQWQKVWIEERNRPFYVQDETGRIKVLPDGAKLDLVPDIQLSTADGEHMTPAAMARLEQAEFTPGGLGTLLRRFCESRGIDTGFEVRFRETNLCPGDPVFVLGTATEYRNPMNEDERIVIRQNKRHPYFYIAEASQKEVVAKLKPRIFLRIVGGALLTVFSVMLLLIFASSK